MSQNGAKAYPSGAQKVGGLDNSTVVIRIGVENQPCWQKRKKKQEWWTPQSKLGGKTLVQGGHHNEWPEGGQRKQENGGARRGCRIAVTKGMCVGPQ